MHFKMNSTENLSTHGETDTNTLYPESHNTVGSTLVAHSKLYRMLLARLPKSDQTGLQKDDEKADVISIGSAPSKELCQGNEDEIEEDPYRWVILFCGFIAQATTAQLASWGVMQDYYDREVFKGSVDSTILSFVGSIGFSFSGILGPVSQVLTAAIGPRWVMFIATVLTTLGMILASFSVEVWQLYLSQGVIYGIGSALLNMVSMSVCPEWFNRRRGLAMGIMFSGCGIGGLVTPFMMSALNEKLDGSWCYRILSIINFMFCMICTALFKKRTNRNKNDFEDTRSLTEKKQPLQLKKIIDFTVCKDVNFLVLCLSVNLSILSYFVPAYFLPSHATKLGLSPSQGSILVAIFSAVNVVGRILSGYLGDKLGVFNINALFCLLSGLSSFLIWTIATNFTILAIFIVIYGLMSGAVFSSMIPTTAIVSGMDRFPSAISLLSLSLTAARLGPSFAGAIQSATDKNSFLAQQLFTGICCVLSATVTLYLKLKLRRGLFAKI